LEFENWKLTIMPRFDGTGPWGLGPGTGWGMGPCGAGRAWRRGWGRGLGYGWRFGWRRYGAFPYQPQITKKEEKELLEEDEKDLEEELKAIKARLAELKNQK
jgi:hypothetical protein